VGTTNHPPLGQHPNDPQHQYSLLRHPIAHTPLKLSKKDQRFYGRGILDNKGPILACLFGLKLLKEMDLPVKKTS
jgi:acetylornithine deacetylase/succinyl-diaminopimelate desuccinylase-like protein